jgi:hypothetical protein
MCEILSDSLSKEGAKETVFAEVEEVTGRRKKLHDQELHDLGPSQYIGSVIKSGSVTSVGNVAPVGEQRNAFGVLMAKAEGSTLNTWAHEDDIKMYRK